MPSRSGTRNSRYDDPYVYDDPYLHSTSSIGKGAPAYEYVGTDEASIAPEPTRRPSSPGYDKRHARTTSPPRHSRHGNAYSPPPRSRRHSPPPKASHHSSPRARDDKKASRDMSNRYRDFAQRPSVQRTKSIGRQGLSFLGDAAAAYAAAQAGGGPRGRSQQPSPEPRRSHRSRRSPSSSPSRSPPRRRSTTHGGRHRPQNTHQRHKSYSASPPPLSRGQDSDRDRDRSRRHRGSKPRSHSGSRSPSPSRRDHRRGRSGPSTSSSFRSGTRDGRSHAHAPDKAIANRWQMAARAALEAGGVTAFRLRKEPGSWKGEKGAKIATAALGAAAIDAFIDKDPRRSKSHGRGVKGMAENAVSSLIASQLMGFKGSSTRSGKSRY